MSNSKKWFPYIYLLIIIMYLWVQFGSVPAHIYIFLLSIIAIRGIIEDQDFIVGIALLIFLYWVLVYFQGYPIFEQINNVLFQKYNNIFVDYYKKFLNMSFIEVIKLSYELIMVYAWYKVWVALTNIFLALDKNEEMEGDVNQYGGGWSNWNNQSIWIDQRIDNVFNAIEVIFIRIFRLLKLICRGTKKVFSFIKPDFSQKEIVLEKETTPNVYSNQPKNQEDANDTSESFEEEVERIEESSDIEDQVDLKELIEDKYPWIFVHVDDDILRKHETTILSLPINAK